MRFDTKKFRNILGANQHQILISAQILKRGKMGTYDHKQVISDYANGKITVEMAMGHSLQHIDKLYEAQTAANLSRYELRSKVDSLENTVTALQTKIDRLTALVEKFWPKRKRNTPGQP
jgi:hypothetical protein